MRSAQGDSLVAVLGIVGTVAADASNLLVGRNLIKQRWQDRASLIPLSVTSMARISSVDASILRVGTMLLRFRFA
jgi:hypothetical protein